MASTSSISSGGSSVSNHTRYDVFLSFCGEDTRETFTDHLFVALVRAACHTFRDNEIPRDVRNQRQCFAVEVDDRAEGSNFTEYNVNRWKAALSEVANLTGMIASGPETNFIAKIVDKIDSVLDLKRVSTLDPLTGMHTRAKCINSWLKNEQSGVEVLAICGMGGSGKTTLAECIYKLHSKKFESSCFLEDIGKFCEQPHGLIELQKIFLTNILGGNSKIISNVSQGTSKIQVALQRKRVLIVLDDIDNPDQLNALLGKKEFRTESKIIITTRNLTIMAWFESTSWIWQRYTLKAMNDEESLELLSWHAFGSKIPAEGYRELAVQVAQYCDGNPLALKLLGASLFVVAEDFQKGDRKVSWEGTLKLLTKDMHSGIFGILRRSFNSLPYRDCQELFLHIACFFIGEDQDYVVKILDPDYSASAGIKILSDRCLLTVSTNNKLMMHHLVQEMGRTLIREESPKDPAKRTRIWCNEESHVLLRKGDGSKTIEGLAFNTRKLKHQTKSKSSAVNAVSLARMEKLKFLQLKYVQLRGSYKNFPELRWLCWHGIQLKTLNSDLFMSSLVAIDMSYGNLIKFEPPAVHKSLKILNLKDSHKLVSIHKLDRLPNLETLILWNCSGLKHVSKAIGGLKHLSSLDLTGCKHLWKVPLNNRYVQELKRLKVSYSGGRSHQEQLFSLPHSLRLLFLNDFNLGCNDTLPMVFSGQTIYYMNLGNNLFEFLPNNIDLKKLRVLDLTCCPRLKVLISLPSTLEELYTYCCVSLEKIKFQSARFRLRKFGYGGCFSLSEIQGLFKLVSIAELNETDLGHMKWVKAYENHEIDLIGDLITEGRIWHIQMLYEYGIMSTFLPGIRDQQLITEYMSSSPFLTFCVPSCPKKCRIQGLNVTFLYRSSRVDGDMFLLFVKISNKTKGVSWIYNPVIFCKPGDLEDVVWFSYWPTGNNLDAGDEVTVSIVVGDGLIVSGCGAGLVYVDAIGDVETENQVHDTKWEEVIEGDLSEFQLTKGLYYLCRRDFYKSMEVATDGEIPEWFRILVADHDVHYTDIKEWRKSRQFLGLKASFTETKYFRGIITGSGIEFKFKLGINTSKNRTKVLEAVSKLYGSKKFYLMQTREC